MTGFGILVCWIRKKSHNFQQKFFSWVPLSLRLSKSLSTSQTFIPFSFIYNSFLSLPTFLIFFCNPSFSLFILLFFVAGVYVYGILSSGDLFFWHCTSGQVQQAKGIPEVVTHTTNLSGNKTSIPCSSMPLMDLLTAVYFSLIFTSVTYFAHGFKMIHACLCVVLYVPVSIDTLYNFFFSF